VSRLNTDLNSHPDREFVDHLIDGLTHGFHTGIEHLPEVSKTCKNLQSVVLDHDATTTLVDYELDKGYLIGPFSDPPYSIFRINPVGIAEGKYSKKKRLIVDLSSPHNDPDNPSLNSLLCQD